MYVIPISVPIFVQGGQALVGTEWKRALVLLRDSLQGRFGSLHVLAPSQPVQPDAEQLMEPCSEAADGIVLHPSFAAGLRLRAYWTSGAHRQWQAQLEQLAAGAQVFHTTMDDAFRPYCLAGLKTAHAHGLPSVFVLDQDIVLRLERTRPSLSPLRRLESRLHAAMYTRQARWACATADLAMLKGRTTLQRYGPYARHMKGLEDTSFFSHEIVAADVVQQRNEELVSRRTPVRLAFCGRLVDIKGVDVSLRWVAGAVRAGADLEFHIIGGGPQLPQLRQLAQDLGIGPRVTFHGAMSYGAELLALLSQSHALLFTPRIDETPRMIFDGYAAGLPLVGRAIDYVMERAAAESAAVLLPQDLTAESDAIRTLVALDSDRTRLAGLAQAALRAAHEHAADRWYARRAQWTFEMVDRVRHRRARSSAAG